MSRSSIRRSAVVRRFLLLLVLRSSSTQDWAGSAWTTSGIPGQAQSCAARTGFSTCEAFVQASGSSFAEACELVSRLQYGLLINLRTDWEVKSVKFYNTTTPL